MNDYKPIETIYNGYRFRSRLEARWAVFFDVLGIEYEYEPEGINEDGINYLPDFYLPEFFSYFEVKRKGLPENARDIAIDKIQYGAYTDTFSGIIAFGDPMDDELFIFCQETDDDGGGSYNGAITIGLHPETKKPYLFTYDDSRERQFFSTWESNEGFIPMVTNEYDTYEYEDFVDRIVMNARLCARQARFEHGETPKIK